MLADRAVERAIGQRLLSAVPAEMIDVAVAAMMGASGYSFAIGRAPELMTTHEKLAALAAKIYGPRLAT